MQIYGLLGRNINYSLSPCMHNAAFKELGIDAEYRIFDVQDSGLGDFFEKMRKGEISGCNVTIPYKEKAMSFMSRYDSLVESIGALNTVVNKKGDLTGYNSDALGFLMALTGAGNGDLDLEPKGKEVFIFGAGGAAKAITFILLGRGVKKIIIADTDNEKAEALADAIVKREKKNVTIAVASEKGQYNEFISKTDLLINATPCGMKPDDEPLFDYRYIHEKLYIFDLIYARESALVREGRSRARKAINGLNMLLYQAEFPFKQWTGVDAPREAMREAVLARLGNT